MHRKAALFALSALLTVPAFAQNKPAISLTHDSATERKTEEQLERLFDQYDLASWTFTHDIAIEQFVVPHSHPKLTLNTRHLDNDDLLVSTYVHEQLHWFLSGRAADANKAIAELRVLYPKIPVGFPEGSDDEDGNYEHLILIYLEMRADAALLGEERADKVIDFWRGDHYKWLYRVVQEDSQKIGAIVARHGLLPEPLAHDTPAPRPPTSTKTICTIFADPATDKVLKQEGDCTTRVTPASTFKVALSLMGFDSGFLKDAHAPVLAYRKGDPDWGGEPWLQPTEPERWMRYSVVWYSQRIAHALGAPRLTKYAKRFNYGNTDFTGDPGKHNGLDRSWIGSSLKISPLEQVHFLDHLVGGNLGVSKRATDDTIEILQLPQRPGGWDVHGKTGSAYPKLADGVTSDEAHAYGWFVGWATKNGRTVVFARLAQDQEHLPGGAGLRVRSAFLEQLPALVEPLTK